MQTLTGWTIILVVYWSIAILIRVFKASELPIIGEIFEAIEILNAQLWSIIRHPLKFTKQIDFHDPAEQKKALKFFFAAVVVDFLINIPAFIVHNYDISLPFYIIESLLLMILGCGCTHVLLTKLGSKQPFVVSVIVQCYAAGLATLVTSILRWPLVMAVGPALSGWEYYSEVTPESDIIFQNALATPVVLIGQLLIYVFLIWGIIVGTVWLSDAHQISKKRVFVGSIISGVATFIMFEYIFFPFWESIKRVLLGIVEFL
jgi:hypothetical protein